MHWLRRNFVAGLLVTVPLAISIVTLVWIIGVIDGFTSPIWERYLGRPIPGLGVVTTALVVLLIGTIASNVLGKRLLQRGESYLLRVPIFRTIYSPVKQLVLAFSPENEAGFKRVVLVKDRDSRYVIGFLTREFEMDHSQGSEALTAVYVPTNHLYLGDVVVFPRDQVLYPDLTVEEGVRIFLTGGMALPSRVTQRLAELDRTDPPQGGDSGRAFPL